MSRAKELLNKLNEESEEKRLQGYIPLLKNIQKAVDALDKFDRKPGSPFGDMAQNFEDSSRLPLTKQLIDSVNSDIKSLKKKFLFLVSYII